MDHELLNHEVFVTFMFLDLASEGAYTSWSLSLPISRWPFCRGGKNGLKVLCVFFPCVVLFFLRNALVFMANKESFLGILEYFLFLLQFFFSIFFRHGFLLGGWRVETRNCEFFFSIWSHLWPHTGWGRLPDLTLGRIPVQALAFGMVNCGPRRFAICLEGVGGRKFSNYLRSTRFRLNIAGGESWNHL